MTPRVVFAAGGTGGHVAPALAVAAAVRAARPEAQIAFIGTPGGPGARMVAAAGYPMTVTGVRPLTKDLRGLLAPPSLLPATAQARRALRAGGANAVLGMGGYPSLPAVVAARTLGVPAMIHEANAVPGLANEVAARMTPHVAISIPGTRFRGREPRVTGFPISDAIAGLDRTAARAEALAAFELDEARATVLVFGGSLGARRLCDAAVALARLWRDRGDVQVLLSTGEASEGRVAAALADGTGRLIVRASRFIERMDLAYAAADVVVARAGGATVAELAATGVPSVLVPLPGARRKEQHANAAWLAGAGGALVLDDAACTGERLAEVGGALIADPAERASMGERARSVARPGAAAEVAAWLLELAEGR